jgi:hypothetical protein
MAERQSPLRLHQPELRCPQGTEAVPQTAERQNECEPASHHVQSGMDQLYSDFDLAAEQGEGIAEFRPNAPARRAEVRSTAVRVPE